MGSLNAHSNGRLPPLMARIRTIKPDFFTSEDIVTLSPRARLLYIALWCEADREGRMVWRPATFKLRYFPADKVDIVPLCLELIGRSLVVLYGQGLAHIPTFLEHQHVNPREAASTLPAPDACPTRDDASNLDMHVQVGKEGKEGKGKEGEGTRELALAADVPKINGHGQHELREQAVSLIAFLNEKSGRNFEAKGANLDHVMARLRDGESISDCRAIIAMKAREWKGDAKMREYLRPETLFNRSKFASYKGALQ